MASCMTITHVCLLVSAFLVLSGFCVRMGEVDEDRRRQQLPANKQFAMLDMQSHRSRTVEFGKQLGKGGHGIVEEAVADGMGPPIALKFSCLSEPSAWEREWQVAERVRANERLMRTRDGTQRNLCLPEARLKVLGVAVASPCELKEQSGSAVMALQFPIAENGELAGHLAKFKRFIYEQLHQSQSMSTQRPEQADAFLIARLLAALHILVEMSAGLSVLHQAGVVHGDIKPANVLLGKLLDTDKWWDPIAANLTTDILLLRPTTLLADFSLSAEASFPKVTSIPDDDSLPKQQYLRKFYPAKMWNGTSPLQTASYRAQELWIARQEKKRLVATKTDVFAFACAAAYIFRVLVDTETLLALWPDHQERFEYRDPSMLIDAWRFGRHSANTQVNESASLHFESGIVQTRMQEEWLELANMFEDSREMRPAQRAVREIRSQLVKYLQQCVGDEHNATSLNSISDVRDKLVVLRERALQLKEDAKGALEQMEKKHFS